MDPNTWGEIAKVALAFIGLGAAGLGIYRIVVAWLMSLVSGSIGILRDELKARQDESKERAIVIEEMRLTLSEQSERLTKIEAQKITLEAETARLTGEQKRLVETIESYKSQINAIQAATIDNQKLIISVQAENNDHIKRRREDEKTIEKLKADVALLTSENQDLRKQYDLSAAEIVRLVGERDALKGEVDELKSRVKALELQNLTLEPDPQESVP